MELDDLQRAAQDAITWVEGLPGFLLPLAAVGLAILGGLLLHWLTFRVLTRVFGADVGLAGSAVRRARRPMRLAFVLLGLIVVLPAVRLPTFWNDGLQHAVLILLIVLVGWTAILLVNHFAERSMRKYRFDTDDNLAARKYVTQVRVLRRTAVIVLGIFTAAAVLLTFESVQRYGVSLFASAGAAGLILGLAARPVLANLIAGIQIAITQPIRLDDVVIVEGEWGWIEEIFATYVVVRIWDWRRMVVPLSYFIEQPFQNWTRESASIIGAVHWYLDYTVPVSAAREKLMELLKNSPHWDGQVANLQVTDTDKDTVTLRGLMSARTSPQAWDLRCEIREKMIEWFQSEYPQALPRLRGELDTPARDDRDTSNGRAA
ncbi:mechanosensitive ion channel family protein [Tateyamaria omphalii]|uniref:Mechanosensitive ion channel protein MscS n=1 Tax=Tateyamaria omphalii TaxID=299262 RepID=A0A1P8MRA2_9RHOB|nr:mechanosensitive ion channel family protein [Tateyamaria omphalii]APX10554.1 mechanosensitive ion channel protein MscS [Tateyamaria omphalii]